MARAQSIQQSTGKPARDIDHVLRVIGQDGLLKLSKAFGGRTVRFAINPMRTPEIVAAVGEEAARALGAVFRDARDVYIPKQFALLLRERDERIHATFDSCTARGMSATKAVMEIAAEFDLTDRTVWRILKKSYEASNDCCDPTP